MPYRKRTYRRKRKSRALIRRRKRKAGLSGRKPVFGISRRASLLYVDSSRTMSCIAGLLTTLNYNANSIHDPYAGFGGAQPLGHDQLATMFNKYEVLGSKITIQAHNISPYAMRIGIRLSYNDNALTDVSRMEEDPKSRWVTLLPTGESGSLRTLSFMVNPSKFLRKPSGDDVLKADFNANPDKRLYFQVMTYSFDESNTSQCVVRSKINYFTRCTDPKVLSAS